MKNKIVIGDKVFIINPAGLYNKPHWIETVIVRLDDNGEDFFTADGVIFITSTGCGGEFDASDNCFSINAECKTWWRADANIPSVEEANAIALEWYND